MKNKIGFIRKNLLKLLTRMQEIAIKSEFVFLYAVFTHIHFYLYFGVTIKECRSAMDDYRYNAFNSLLDRHIAMVRNVNYNNGGPKYGLRSSLFLAILRLT